MHGHRSLQTPRIAFRPLAEEDRELFLELFTCPQTMRYVGPALSAERATVVFNSLVGGHAPIALRYWVLLAPSSGMRLGLASLEAGSTVAFGLMMRSGARGQGLGREAFDVLLAEATTAAGDSRLVVRVDPKHPIMARWVRDAGFEWLGEAVGAGELWRR